MTVYDLVLAGKQKAGQYGVGAGYAGNVMPEMARQGKIIAREEWQIWVQKYYLRDTCVPVPGCMAYMMMVILKW
jgi:hypothetical protein